MGQVSIFYTVTPNIFGSSKREHSSFQPSSTHNFEVAHKILESLSIPDVSHHCHLGSERTKRTKLHARHYSAELQNAYSFSAIPHTPYVKISQKSQMASGFDLGTPPVFDTYALTNPKLRA